MNFFFNAFNCFGNGWTRCATQTGNLQKRLANICWRSSNDGSHLTWIRQESDANHVTFQPISSELLGDQVAGVLLSPHGNLIAALPRGGNPQSEARKSK